MIAYQLGENYNIITGDTKTVNKDVYAIKALGGDVVIDATSASSDSDDLISQTVSDGDIMTSLRGWSSITKKSGSGTVIIYLQT